MSWPGGPEQAPTCAHTPAHTLQTQTYAGEISSMPKPEVSLVDTKGCPGLSLLAHFWVWTGHAEANGCVNKACLFRQPS